MFGGKDSLQLKGSEVTAELKYLLNLLTLCWHFSKKPFPLFLEETGYTDENVLLQEPKAGVSLLIIVQYLYPCSSHTFSFEGGWKAGVTVDVVLDRKLGSKGGN